MSADKRTTTGEHWPREISPEEAAKLRAHYLALAREAALLSGSEETSSEQDHSDSASTDATVAAFVLPGD